MEKEIMEKINTKLNEINKMHFSDDAYSFEQKCNQLSVLIRELSETTTDEKLKGLCAGVQISLGSVSNNEITYAKFTQQKVDKKHAKKRTDELRMHIAKALSMIDSDTESLRDYFNEKNSN